MIAVGKLILFLKENQSNNKFCCECGNNGIYLHDDKRKEKMTRVGDVFGGRVGVAFRVKFITTGSETGNGWMRNDHGCYVCVSFWSYRGWLGMEQVLSF